MNVTISSTARRTLVGFFALSLTVLLGCAHVKPEQLSTELEKLRGEVREGDRTVASDLGTRIDGLDARLGVLADQLDQLSQTFDVTVQRMETAIRFNVPVFFDFDEASVRPDDRIVLDRFATVVKGYYPDVLITAEGFTDPAGPLEYNRMLGMRRAEAVVDYLAQEGGLDRGQLRSVSYGEETARLMNEGRGPGEPGVKNRRVVLVIEGKGTATPGSTATTAS